MDPGLIYKLAAGVYRIEQSRLALNTAFFYTADHLQKTAFSSAFSYRREGGSD